MDGWMGRWTAAPIIHSVKRWAYQNGCVNFQWGNNLFVCLSITPYLSPMPIQVLQNKASVHTVAPGRPQCSCHIAPILTWPGHWKSGKKIQLNQSSYQHFADIYTIYVILLKPFQFWLILFTFKFPRKNSSPSLKRIWKLHIKL